MDGVFSNCANPALESVTKRDEPGDNGAAIVLVFVCLLHDTMLINFAL